ncbi:hypothetical protein [Ensifer adhaerens]|uniref:hypothetical protein n=1 Tax=Ensifer adhaerens TaxID=106592 RepID=UPI000FDC45EA|nr:hypothetical protein [Ensifer adhaerens]MDF8352944.1 hypothetical protein [Ensifer adhaerens]THA66019.1 hypothetical protein E5176_13855 [Ensifer adhaerens]
MIEIEDFGITEYSFSISGHRKRYNLTTVLHLFGEKFCRGLEAAWRRAATFKAGDTAHGYFKKLRLLLQGLGAAGSLGKDEVATRVFQTLQGGRTPTQKDWQHVINEFLRVMGDVDDRSLTNSTKRKVRDTYVEAARSALNWLVAVRYLPAVQMRQRTASKFSTEVGTDSLASLLYKAGRLDLTNKTELEASNEYIGANAKALAELRSCYVAEFLSEYETFQRGQVLLGEKPEMSIDEFEEIILRRPSDRIGNTIFGVEIGLSDGDLFSVIIRYYKDVYHNSRDIVFGLKKFQKLVAWAGGHAHLQSFIEATTKALNAAFHIILIDTGLNVQPTKDLGEDPYVGASKRGKRQIATIAEKKNRAGGKEVKGRLREDEVGEVSVKVKGEVSGFRVVEMFREMSKPMRPVDGPLAERLWIYRRPGEYTVRHNLGQIDRDWHYGFLDRHKDNALFGGLSVTKRVIRRSFMNAKRADGSFDVNLAMAIAGQSTPEMAYHYLDLQGVKAILQEMIRKFLNAWEAVSASSLDDAAAKIGVDPSDFERRKELGLKNGLHFALFGDRSKSKKNTKIEEEALLSNSARRFTVRENTMRDLCLAKVAMYKQMEKVLYLNPKRFIRKWIPFLGIVEGYIIKIKESRFASQFAIVQSDVEGRIASGDIAVPVIW